MCHGKQGKGDGPFALILDTRVADLTTLAKQNGGVFPFARVYEIIDGEQVVKAHSPRDMPIWGTEYRIRGAENYGEFPYDPDAYVRARILALTEYLYRLQAKGGVVTPLHHASNDVETGCLGPCGALVPIAAASMAIAHRRQLVGAST